MNKILLFMLILLLSACGAEETVRTLEYPSPDQELFPDGARLSLSLAKDVFSGSPSLIEITIKNDSQQDYEYGDYYYIEVNKNGKWYTMTHSDAVFLNNPQLNDFGHMLAAGSQVEQVFSIEMLDVTLILGKYRLVKTLLSQDEPFHEVSLAFPFTVK